MIPDIMHCAEEFLVYQIVCTVPGEFTIYQISDSVDCTKGGGGSHNTG
jgi:hypothetical protein